MKETAQNKFSTVPKMFVTAQGPVGFIYPHRSLNDDEKERIAMALVREANIPLILTLIRQEVVGYTKEGKFCFPDEADQIVGEKHPYLKSVIKELESLCRHPDAGTFVISGWRKGRRTISFPQEYGSHAGPGPHETDGFAMLPRDIHISSDAKYLRPLILRNTALQFLKGERGVFNPMIHSDVPKNGLRIMTYNVHSCIGMDGKLSPERIARVIAHHNPDIIALQELDAGRLRTHRIDQAKRIAELLDMEHHFHPVRMIEEEMYGNAILSRYPMKIIQAAALPRFWGHSYFEPRGALWVEIQFQDTTIQLINTHLSFWGREQKLQAETLCGPEWLGSRDCEAPLILCGDFNALPHSSACRSVRQKLEDAQLKIDRHKPLNTWFGHLPLSRIDHIFVSSDIKVAKVEVPSTRLEKVASDHLPLIADLYVHHK